VSRNAPPGKKFGPALICHFFDLLRLAKPLPYNASSMSSHLVLIFQSVVKDNVLSYASSDIGTVLSKFRSTNSSTSAVALLMSLDNISCWVVFFDVFTVTRACNLSSFLLSASFSFTDVAKDISAHFFY
jgi:hypothetical protein